MDWAQSRRLIVTIPEPRTPGRPLPSAVLATSRFPTSELGAYLWQMPQHTGVIAVKRHERLFWVSKSGISLQYWPFGSLKRLSWKRSVTSPFRDCGSEPLGTHLPSAPVLGKHEHPLFPPFHLSPSPPLPLANLDLASQAAESGAELTSARVITGRHRSQIRHLMHGAQALKSPDAAEITSSCPCACLINNTRCHLLTSSDQGL